jgi:hypothetical protein
VFTIPLTWRRIRMTADVDCIAAGRTRQPMAAVRGGHADAKERARLDLAAGSFGCAR